MGFVAACKTAACVRGRCLISECLRGRRLISAWVRGRCLLNALWQHLTGERGLLFSDAALSEVQEVLESFQPEEFARAGFVAERTVTVQAGSEGLAGMAHSLEPQLRQLGMPTVLRDGRIHLLGEFTACTAGKPLTSSQAQILKHLGIRCSKFVVGLDAVWTQGGNFLRLAA
eukprot:GHVT01056049.1.p3 GENE.GHVT01056049.1~~GHVT01056049.1.p3  ORF type:complete len:172 (+),score=33.86 GHVT01056049.1:580-1095(+)